jgi:hypothetical protein
VAALVLLIVALAAIGILSSRPDGTHVVRHQPLVYNFFHPDSLPQMKPAAGELLRLEHRRDGRIVSQFVVEPLHLPPYRGNSGGLLPILAERELPALQRRFPGMAVVEEGKARINNAAGYSVSFIAGRDPLVWGRLVLLPKPGKHSREGVRLVLLGTRAGGNEKLTDIGNEGELRDPYRTFKFGTGTV